VYHSTLGLRVIKKKKKSWALGKANRFWREKVLAGESGSGDTGVPR